MAIETLMTLARRAGHERWRFRAASARARWGRSPTMLRAEGGAAYGWNPSQLGQNTLLYAHGLELLARNRDAVRNSSWAAAAVDSYVANAIGRGIRWCPQHPDEQIRELILKKWKRWIRESDVEYDPKNPASGQTDFYGQQMIIAREVMEAGEVFVRFRPRPPKEGLAVPLQLQLIEAEQLPLWRNQSAQEMPDAQPRPLRYRVPARWSAGGLPLLEGASRRDDVLPARGASRSSACRRRTCCTCTSRFAPASSAASRG